MKAQMILGCAGIVLFGAVSQDLQEIPSNAIGTTLLGAVLSWLMFKHLPAKDALFDKMITDKDKLVSEVLKNAQNEFKEALEKVVKHCKEETKVIVDELKLVKTEVVDSRDESREEHKESRHLVSEIGHTLGLKVAAGDITVKDRTDKKRTGQ